MSVTALREGLADNLAAIPGLRVSAFVPDNPTPPIAVIVPNRGDFDQSFHRGVDTITFDVIVLAHRASERSAQSTLDSYLDSSGDTSVKVALESDKTLGGKAFDLRVSDWHDYGPTPVGETQYMSATFTVTVLANT